MTETEQLHLISQEETINVIDLSNCTDGSLTPSSSCSKFDQCSSTKPSRNSEETIPVSTIGDTSSPASSIDFFSFYPEKDFTESSSASCSKIELSGNSNINADIDECMQSMLTTANELSCISSTESRKLSFIKKRFRMGKKNKIEAETDSSDHSEENKNDVSSNSPSALEIENPCSSLNFAEVESLIQELNTVNYQQRKIPSLPKFSTSDDQYTTNNYVKLIRSLGNSYSNNLPETSPLSRIRAHDALMRTTSWAANLPTRPPPLPTSSVPATPIMSRYRIVRPIPHDHSSSKSINHDQYFGQSESVPNLGNRMTSILNKSNSARGHRSNKSSPLCFNLKNNSVDISENQMNGRHLTREGMVFENPLLLRNHVVDSVHTSLSSLEVTSILQQSGVYDDNLSQHSNEVVLVGSRIDDFLDYSRNYLYEIQPCEKLDLAREAALQRLTSFLDLTMVMRIKQWGSKFDVFKNIKNKLNKSSNNNFRSDELFGMPLSMVQALNRNGLPFPQFVVDIVEFLKEHALDMDGIFRRCGSQKRIQEMREFCNILHCDESLPEDLKTINQANDLSDLLKQYLRSIPQRLVPESVSEILIAAMSRNPSEKYLEILKYVLLILPDENREALFFIIDFLGDISERSTHNLMTIDNLAICTLPTIFAFSDESQNSAPRRRRKTVAVMNTKDIINYGFLKDALCLLITHRNDIKQIPVDLVKSLNPRKRKRISKEAMAPLQEIKDVAALKCFVTQLFEEYEENWKNWTIELITDCGILYSTRDVNDNSPIKSCRVQLTVPVSPQVAFQYITERRTKWDSLMASSKRSIVDLAHREDVRHVVFNNYGGNVDKQAVLVRAWETNELDTGRAYISEKSCKHALGGTNEFVDVYHNVFLICPHNNKSIINYITRIDLKGKSSDWYSKTFRQLLISQMSRLAMQFKNLPYCNSVNSSPRI